MSSQTLSEASSESAALVKDFHTTLLYCDNAFPSEDVVSIFRPLQQRARDSRFPILGSFLSECTKMLKGEVALLHEDVRNAVPYFENILALATHFTEHRHGPLSSALDGALLCIAQIGMAIGYHEEGGHDFLWHRNNVKLVGLSIGLLSATAISTSQSLHGLLRTGVASARVAFRLGVHVDNVSRLLEASDNDDEPPASWAFVVTGLSEDEVQQELDQYNASTSALNKVFISAADKHSVSVTGPPSRLRDAFATCHRLRYARGLPLPVFGGLCHASHLYNSEDVSSIVYGGAQTDDNDHSVQATIVDTASYIPVYSPQHGKPFLSGSWNGLVTAVVAEILMGRICLDKLTGGLLHDLELTSTCHFVQFQTSIISSTLLSDLEKGIERMTIVKEDLSAWTATTELDATECPSSFGNAKLAIVGMSCRLPGGADNPELFWKLLVEGKDVHTTVPADRFDIEAHFDDTGRIPNTTQSRYGNFVDRPGFFDASFFNMSPKEAEQTDPMHRLALVTAYEALEASGYAPHRTPSTDPARIGTFYGQASDDWREVNAGQNIGTYAVPGGERAFANGRINYFFKFGGPSFNIDTACSSGLAAVNAACSSLWSGEADTVLAGGLNVISNPDNFAMLCKGHFLSKTGQCKVWDKSADGYCRADGIGAVVIKRLADAEADNDPVLAVISAGYTNHSAEAISITHPHAGAQMDNYRRVIAHAAVDPLDVSYVELHGTGTQAGDAVESESVVGVFAPVGARRKPEQHLHLGAVKSNVGHSEAAAGLTSLIKVLLMYGKSQIPPHVGIVSEINPVVAKHLDRRNAGLVLANTPWPKTNLSNGTTRPRYAIVNSFGAHGGNTTLLLEDGPARSNNVHKDPRTTYPIILSAKSKASLRRNVEALLLYLQDAEKANTNLDIGDLSYTLCARRIHHPLRISTTAKTVSHLQAFLQGELDKKENASLNTVRAIPSTPRPVVFAFTGQGAFYQGIGKELYAHFPFYQEQIHKLDRLATKLGFPSLLSVLTGDGEAGEEEDSRTGPLLSQLSILVVEIALTRLWKFLGITPTAVIGHSLGEYAAFVAAGVLSAADAIYLVGQRALLIHKHCVPESRGMLAVRASVESIETSLSSAGSSGKHSYEVACKNGREDTVLSGPGEDLDAIQGILDRDGILSTRVKVDYAFHSAQMDAILPAFERVTKHVAFRSPTIPVLSPLLADCVFDGKTINATYLSRATREPVLFVEALDAAHDLGIVEDENTVWLDIGPHPICSSLLRNWRTATPSGTKTDTILPSLHRKEDNFETVAGTLSRLHSLGLPVLWNEYFRPYEHTHHLVQGLPSYQWNEKDYWIPYVGTWTLDKALSPEERAQKMGQGSLSSTTVPNTVSPFHTSSIHQVIRQEVIHGEQKRVELTAISDLQSPELSSSVHGHKMNGHGVATSSIWGDMAMTLGEHLYRLLFPSTENVCMNMSNLDVQHAQVVSDDATVPHKILTKAELSMSDAKSTSEGTHIQWFHIPPTSSSVADDVEPFATCTVRYEDPDTWKREWSRMNHFVKGRIVDLERLSSTGEAIHLNHHMAYVLFGNVVDYATPYRGMRSVIQSGYEAVADVHLCTDVHGTWHTAPQFIDSICHVGGLVLNGGGVVDARESFYVTPGWSSFRMLPRMKSGDHYQSYVRMAPTDEKNMFSGDVYVLQDGAIVGMMGSMLFRRVPRVLMNRFFSPEASSSTPSKTKATKAKETTKATDASKTKEPMLSSTDKAQSVEKDQEDIAIPSVCEEDAKHETDIPVANSEENQVIADCLRLIARETGLELGQLVDEASFVELGVDSLMSLVLSEKFRSELQLDVKSSVFLECANLAELKEWLIESC